MKILHVLTSNQFSGAENVVCQIVGMFSNVPDVQMAYCSRDGQIRQALLERNIDFAPVSNLSVSELKRVIREQRPDIIHAHDMRASLMAALSCGEIPLVSHIHNNAFDSRGLSLKSIAYLYAAKKARHIFWVSQSAFKGYCFHQLFKKKSSILYNIVDIDRLYERMQLDTQTYDYDVTYLGRLTYPKNPQRLMRVFRLLKEKMPDIKIAVIGTGELEAETKALAEEYGLSEYVEFLGFQSNPLKILHDSKVMIMTSRWEGTPMCALEAMSFGVPIVSTPVDGLRDLVVSGENGFLTDKDEEIADRITDILRDDSLRKRCAEEALKKARIFNDKELYKRKIYNIWCKCIEKG